MVSLGNASDGRTKERHQKEDPVVVDLRVMISFRIGEGYSKNELCCCNCRIVACATLQIRNSDLAIECERDT